MKKWISFLVIALIAATVYAALDSTLLRNDVILAPQGTTPTRTELELVAAASYVTNFTVQSTIRAKADYYGKADLIAAFNGNDDASYTNALFLITGTNATLGGTTVTTQLTGVTADAIGIYTTEIDFDTQAGTHWAVRFVGETDNAKAARFAAKLIHGAVPTTAQTVNSAAYDKINLKGVANIVVAVATPDKAAATFSGTVQIQSATASTGTWANVSGMAATITGASGGTATIPWDTTGGNRYIRAVYTTTNDTAKASVTVNGYRP